MDRLGRIGYGTTHFKSDWRAGALHGSTTRSEGTAAFGVGGNCRIDGNNSLRLDDTRLHFATAALPTSPGYTTSTALAAAETAVLRR